MSDRRAISIRGVVKRFPADREGVSLFKRLATLAAPGRNVDGRVALAGVDLDVCHGELVGLIGDNGAGKTTLLKTIAGLYGPTSGSVERNGRVVFLAGLGVGMMGTLSVRRNYYLYGSICGLRRHRLDELFEPALEWAGLSDYADAPVRALSQGMKARLAFSVTRQIDAEVVLMDEAFAAGDERFRKKSQSFFAPEARRDRAMLVSTHSLDFVEQFCTSAVWLRSGKIAGTGSPKEVVEQYRQWIRQPR